MIGKLKTLFHLKKPQKPQKTIDERISDLYDSLQVDTLAVAFGDDILPFATSIVNGIGKLRNRIKDTTGFIIPPIRVINDKNLQENEIQILIRNKIVFTDFAIPKIEYVLKTVISNLTRISTKNVADIFTNEITEKYIDFVQKNNSWLIWNILRLIPVTGIRTILINILQDGKSISDIVFIFEKICEYATENENSLYAKNPYKIAEYIKKDLV